MWWPGRRRNDSNTDSEEALKDAKQQVRKAEKRTKEVTEVVDALRELRERNHFADAMEEIIVKRRGSLRYD